MILYTVTIFKHNLPVSERLLVSLLVQKVYISTGVTQQGNKSGFAESSECIFTCLNPLLNSDFNINIVQSTDSEIPTIPGNG